MGWNYEECSICESKNRFQWEGECTCDPDVCPEYKCICNCGCIPYGTSDFKYCHYSECENWCCPKCLKNDVCLDCYKKIENINIAKNSTKMPVYKIIYFAPVCIGSQQFSKNVAYSQKQPSKEDLDPSVVIVSMNEIELAENHYYISYHKVDNELGIETGTLKFSLVTDASKIIQEYNEKSQLLNTINKQLEELKRKYKDIYYQKEELYYEIHKWDDSCMN